MKRAMMLMLAIGIAAVSYGQISTQFVRYLQVWDSIKFKNGNVAVTGFDNDTALSANSGTVLATQNAVKKYIDNRVSTSDTTTRFGGLKTIFRARQDSLALAAAIAARGTVNSFGFTSANGFNSFISNPNTNPNLTLSITSTPNMLRGNGSGGIVAADSAVHYVTPTALNNRFSSLSLSNSGVLHSSPVTFTNNGSGAWSGTLSLVNQSPFTILRRGSGTGTPSFGAIDTNYFGGNWQSSVGAVAPLLSTTNNWTGANTFSGNELRVFNTSSSAFRVGGGNVYGVNLRTTTTAQGVYFDGGNWGTMIPILEQSYDSYTDLSVVRNGDMRFKLNGATALVVKENSRNVCIGTTSDISSAILNVSSTTKGLLLPRMTKTQRDAIVSPVAGLVVYQTDNTPGLRCYNGTNWVRFTETTD